MGGQSGRISRYIKVGDKAGDKLGDIVRDKVSGKAGTKWETQRRDKV